MESSPTRPARIPLADQAPGAVPAPDLRVDAGESRRDARPCLRVAVGVLLRGDGAFLMCTRPAGKVYAGYWEFPGGKLEPGETVEAALARELDEELGLRVDPAHVERWRELRVDYPHALTQLHFCRLRQWQGALQMREGQRSAWLTLPVPVAPVLPGAVPVLEWLAGARDTEPPM